jgi:alpha-beta hydrolase superfamily lysophospholipase
MSAEQTKPRIVLIHGLWVTPLSWEKWVERYSGDGYEVLAPAWPGLEGDVESLRADSSAFDDLGLTEVVDHYAEIIGKLDAPPIIIGHSFGGAITQLLLDRELGLAGVAIDSAPVRGVLTLPLSTLRVGNVVLKNPANYHRAVMPSAEQFHYSFTNTMSEQEALPVYERYAVPGPGKLLFQASLANFNPHAATKIDFHNDNRAPLLLIAGGKDHIAPASVTRANAKLQSKSKAITAYKEFPERSHYTLGQEGWRRSRTSRCGGRWTRSRSSRRADRGRERWAAP